MSDFTSSLSRALETQAKGLRRLRKSSESEAWQAVQATATENLRDSTGTEHELYWRAALEIAERQLVAAEDPRWGS